MKPQPSWADTDTEPAVANSAAAAITIAGCFIDMGGISSSDCLNIARYIWELSIQFVDLICNYLYLHATRTARPRSIIRQSLSALGDRSLRCCRSAWQVEGFLHLARHRLKRRSQEQHCYYFRQDSAGRGLPRFCGKSFRRPPLPTPRSPCQIRCLALSSRGNNRAHLSAEPDIPDNISVMRRDKDPQSDRCLATRSAWSLAEQLQKYRRPAM